MKKTGSRKLLKVFRTAIKSALSCSSVLSWPGYFTDDLHLADKSPWDRFGNEKVKLLLKGYSPDLSVVRRRATSGNTQDVNFVPKMVVFRHTHLMEHTLEEGKYLDVNTGSWQRSILLIIEGEL